MQLGVTVREAVVQLLPAVLKNLPLGGPVLEAVSGILDQGIEEYIRAASPAAAAELLRDPIHPQDIIGRATGAIASSVKIADSAKNNKLAESSLSQAEQNLRALADDRRHLDIAVTDVLLEQLPSGTAEQADSAASELVTRGNVITRDQLQRLTGIMRNGTQSWTSAAYVPWPGSHCTCWENKSVRYFAAQAMQSIQSPLISDSLRTEAEQIQSSADTYTKISEPGWICYVNGSSAADAICAQGSPGVGGSAVKGLLSSRVRCWPVSG